LGKKIALFRGGLGADQRIAAITKLCRMAFFGYALRVLGPIGATVDLWIGRQWVGICAVQALNKPSRQTGVKKRSMEKTSCQIQCRT
jgi:hypothetical protein